MYKLVYLLAIALIGFVQSQRYDPNWESLDSRPLPSWYDEGKVGIFLHWGVYSVPSFNNEWFWYHWKHYQQEKYIKFMEENYKPGFAYQEFAPMFTAEFFDPDHWADIFKRSGAKYVVLTSKHHDGFSLYKATHGFNWNAVDIGPHRDLVGDLGTAVRNAGLKYGLYHSLLEWWNPFFEHDAANNWTTREFPEKKLIPGLKELVKKYQPEVVWSDGEWDAADKYWGSEDFLAWLYNDSPVKDTVVTNDRWGNDTKWKHGGFFNGDDRLNPGVLIEHKWENAFTIDKPSWSYRREAKLSDFMTPEELMKEIVVSVSCGGNVLVNVGPTKEGTIPLIYEERLTQMGEWLEINGEAIYGSIPWTTQNDTMTEGVWYTTNKEKTKVYAMATSWPGVELVLGSAPELTEGAQITMLGSDVGLTLEWERNPAGGIIVKTPRPDMNTSKWAWTFVIHLS